MRWTPDQLPDLSGKTYVITGGNSGLGLEAAMILAKKGGRVVHYIGDPQSPNGARTTRGVVERLRAAGFARVQPNPAAFGVVAVR